MVRIIKPSEFRHSGPRKKTVQPKPVSKNIEKKMRPLSSERPQKNHQKEDVFVKSAPMDLFPRQDHLYRTSLQTAEAARQRGEFSVIK